MTSSGLTTAVLSRVYRPLTRWAAKEILEGRAWDLAGQARRRWLSSDVDEFLRAAWERVEELLPGAELERLPNLGNRHNVFLAVVTTAAYQALCAQGMSRDYAATLIADLGFKIYSRMLAMAALRLDGRTLGARARMSRALRGLLRFPFSAPGAPGYAVRAWEDADGFHTHWTHCPPQSFVRRLIERDGDHGELEAFYRSWCLYDWPGADILAADGLAGHYSRPHTLSRGDAVCDMCWKA